MRNYFYRGFSHWGENERTRFLVVGAANTGIGYLIFSMYYLAFGRWVHYIVVALMAHVTSVCVAFYLQKRLVFRSELPWWREFVRYNIGLSGILLLNVLALFFLVSVIGMQPLVGQALVVILSVGASYVVHRRYSFARRNT